MASSSVCVPRTRTSRKSVRRYRSPTRRNAENGDGRPLQSSRSQGSGRSTPLRLKVDPRHLLRVGRRLEERILLEAEYFRGQVRWKLPPRGVVLLHALVVAHPLDRDSVFGARQLVHQPIELLVGFEVRIIFGDRQQAAQRGGLLV